MNTNVIAELCQNHNGDKNLLFKMVDKAKEAGAWACKVQSFFADDLSESWNHDYDRLKKLELSWETQKEFVDYCKKIGVVPMTSVYTAKYIPELQKCGFLWIKIGSAQAEDIDLIRELKAWGYKVIISTGGRDLTTMKKCSPIDGVLHCVSNYPSGVMEANLSRMTQIPCYWKNTPYGLSDHTSPGEHQWWLPARCASFMGASFIERHFTLLDKRETKDGSVSANFEELKSYISMIGNKDGVKPESIGMFYMPQKEQEITNIKRYEGRWRCYA